MPTPNTDHRGRDGEGGATYLNKGEAGVTYPPERTAVLVIDPVTTSSRREVRPGT
jgi:hypothetical protein